MKTKIAEIIITSTKEKNCKLNKFKGAGIRMIKHKFVAFEPEDYIALAHILEQYANTMRRAARVHRNLMEGKRVF